VANLVSPQARARELRRAQTEVERRVWLRLRNRQLVGVKFRRQVPIGPFIADFAALDRKLVIELDGGQHLDSASDRARGAYLEKNGYRVLRFWNHEVLDDLEGVLERIRHALEHGALHER
jgi:very-short-patch-repair endonuclease